MQAHMVVTDGGRLYSKYGANASDATAAAAGTWRLHPHMINGSSDRVLTSNSVNEINGESNLTFDGTCLVTPNIRITSGATNNYILTSTATGLGKWCEPTDISANLGTGDLLYYNGATISGATLNQTTTTSMTMKNCCLMMCSDANKIISMCDVTTNNAWRNICICSGLGCGGYGGCMFLHAGHGCRYAGGTAGSALGGWMYICAGTSNNQTSGTAQVSCGGNICMQGGNTINIHSTTTKGGDVCLFGGYASGPYTLSQGGSVILSAGWGYSATYCGCVMMYGRCVVSSACITCATCCLRVQGMGTSTYGICLGSGCGAAAQGWVTVSDCRTKTNIESISNALSIVERLHGVYFNYCDDLEHRNVGLIAQEVLPVLPEVVGCGTPDECEIEKGITDVSYAVGYGNITAVLIEAIKEQQQQICCLREEINILKGC